MTKHIVLDGKKVGESCPCYIIAEIGSNHNRNLDVARKMIEVAKESGCDAVKFQSYTADGLYSRYTPRISEMDGRSHPGETPYELIKRYKDKIGVVVLESIRDHFPEKEFFATIRKVTSDLNIVLIVDEITAGFRLNNGGAHLLFGLTPDMAVFAKGMSNGFAMAAIIGKKKVMNAAQNTFVSSTYWTDRVGPAAALATIKKIMKSNLPQHLDSIGKKVQVGWNDAAARYNIPIEVGGIHPLGHFSFKYREPLVLKTLFTQLMLGKGFLATTAFYASFAHKEEHLEKYLQATDEVFRIISKALAEGRPEKYLKASVCHAGFKRLT